MWRLYLQAHDLRSELNTALRTVRHASAADPRVLARDELALWITDYCENQATYIDGLRAVQTGMDALYGEVTE